jgi:peptidoglycan/LPS O-acetylase OafA/YrhL
MAVEKGERIDVFDGLRGLAIFLVLIFHVWQLSWQDFGKFTLGLIPWWLTKVGFIGVEIFFVISGFCIAYPFARGHAPTWKEFYWRRAIKIVPSYLFAIAVMAIFFDNGTVWGRPWLHLLTHFTFTHNWLFETYYSTLGPAWSLAVEVQFYALFPLLLLFFRRSPYLTACAMMTAAALWRLWAWRASEGDSSSYTMRINQLPGCLDLFACGMLAAFLSVALTKRPLPWLRRAGMGASIAALAALLFLFRGYDYVSFEPCGTPLWQSRWRLPIGLLVMLIAVGGTLAPRAFQQVLANPPARFFGAVSYNLYLWHKLVTDELFRRKIPTPATPDAHDDPQWQLHYTLLVIGVSLLLSAALTWGLERPLLRLGRKRRAAVQ